MPRRTETRQKKKEEKEQGTQEDAGHAARREVAQFVKEYRAQQEVDMAREDSEASIPPRRSQGI
jgi:hypothetical protein